VNVLDRISSRADERLLAMRENTGLALDFSWQGDRWAQRLTAILDVAEYPIASSHEAVSQDHQHISQAFQDLSRQQIANVDLIFLVGLANKAYWSTSVEVLPSGRGFQWDVSCKPADAETLSCEYSLLLPPQAHNSNSVRMKLAHDWVCVLECESVSPHQTSLVLHDRHLQIHTAIPDRVSNKPVRWKYRCELRQDA
jgi:hypothetical protein